MIGQCTNHLWQSTVFVAAIALTALALRQNRAQARYWLWMSASIKFLVPCALLISLGSRLFTAWPASRTTPQILPPAVSLNLEQLTQPFPLTPPAAALAPTPIPAHPTHWLAIAVPCLWLCGFLTVALVRLRAWLRLRALLKASVPLLLDAPVAVRSSATLLEPGVVGLIRPILFLPESILESLSRPQLEAVIAHELTHIRRRDNLTASIHMFVEAVFWFHPLVWWIGARLLEERERACDEAVLSLGGEPRDYADAILSVCRLCVESPIACVSGISGADLKKRLVRIMTQGPGSRLTLGKKLLLAAVATITVAVPVMLGQAQAARRLIQAAAHAFIAQNSAPSPATSAPTSGNTATADPAFASVVIHHADPNPQRRIYGLQYGPSGRILLAAVPLQSLILMAYEDPQGMELVHNAPAWTESDPFDITVQLDQADLADWDTLSYAQRFERLRPRLRTMLAQRFSLQEHVATLSTPVYLLEQAPGGSKLKEVPAPTPEERKAAEQPQPANPPTDSPRLGIYASKTGWIGHAVKIPEVSNILAYAIGMGDKPILDHTNLSGYYDLTLSLIKQDGGLPLEQQMEDQLGLRLEARNVPMRNIVIDSVSKPAIDTASGLAPELNSEPAPPPPPQIHFDVVSWKRCSDGVKGNQRIDMPLDSDYIAYHCQPIRRIIYFAYMGPMPFELSGHPSWVDDDLYEFQAKVAPDDIAAWKALSIDDRRVAVRNLLTPQLKLQLHTDKTPQPVYALTVIKGGAKLTEYKAGEQWKIPNGTTMQGRQQAFIGNTVYLQNMRMSQLATQLSARLDHPVVDQTGLDGSYDVVLPLAKGQNISPSAPAGDDQDTTLDAGLARVGLKLVPTKAEADGLVIDHIERPPEN